MFTCVPRQGKSQGISAIIPGMIIDHSSSVHNRRCLVMGKSSLLAAVGGRATVERVHKIFYDKIYDHPWLSQFFKNVSQDHIEKQQTDFMLGNMGGVKTYRGLTPVAAHRHIFIDNTLFDIRHAILAESLKEAHIAEPQKTEWLALDARFRSVLVKQSPAQCTGRYGEKSHIVVIARPKTKRAA